LYVTIPELRFIKMSVLAMTSDRLPSEHSNERLIKTNQTWPKCKCLTLYLWSFDISLLKQKSLCQTLAFIKAVQLRRTGSQVP